MNRETYVTLMQGCMEDLHENKRKKNEAMDALNDQYRQDLTVLNEEKRAKERQIRDEYQETLQSIEKTISRIKIEWAQEHPVNEIRIIE